MAALTAHEQELVAVVADFVDGEIRPRVLSLASACSLFGRGKSLLTVHSGAYPLTEEARNATPNSVRSRIFRRFTRLIGVNDAIADVFRRSGVAEERVRVILPYVLTPPDKQVELPSDLKAFCDKHSPLLVSVGGLEKDYDPLFLVDAMSDVVKEFPNAGLMIVGDGSMRDEVESVVAARVCADRIFLAGNVDHAVTLHMINGDAISVREALFLGTPVIATDNGMRPEGVHLVGMQDGAGLIAKLKQALAAGKKPQAEIVDGGANIREIVDIYEEIAASV